MKARQLRVLVALPTIASLVGLKFFVSRSLQDFKNDQLKATSSVGIREQAINDPRQASYIHVNQTISNITANNETRPSIPSSDDATHCPTMLNHGQETRRAPDFIIAGAQKAGTSALYRLLKQHPNIQASEKFEAHFFDQQIHRLKTTKNIMSLSMKNVSAIPDEVICEARQNYQELFEDPSNPRRLTFEKTPSLLLLPYVPGLIDRVAPNRTKILILLRNPIDRAYSGWKMHHELTLAKASKSTKKALAGQASFEKSLQGEIQWMKSIGLVGATTPNLKSFRDFQRMRLRKSNTTSNDEPFAIISTNNTLQERLEIVRRSQPAKMTKRLLLAHCYRGMYAQQLLPWIEQFGDGRLKVVRYESFLENRSAVFHDILDFVGANDSIGNNSNDTSLLHPFDEDVLARDYRPYADIQRYDEPMDSTVRQYLQAFYKPYNDELADLLGEEWRGVWDD